MTKDHFKTVYIVLCNTAGTTAFLDALQVLQSFQMSHVADDCLGCGRRTLRAHGIVDVQQQRQKFATSVTQHHLTEQWPQQGL